MKHTKKKLHFGNPGIKKILKNENYLKRGLWLHLKNKQRFTEC